MEEHTYAHIHVLLLKVLYTLQEYKVIPNISDCLFSLKMFPRSLLFTAFRKNKMA